VQRGLSAIAELLVFKLLCRSIQSSCCAVLEINPGEMLCCVADKSQGDADALSLAEHIHTVHITEGDS